MRHRRRAPQERAARATAVARSLAALLERPAERAPERSPPVASSPVARRAVSSSGDGLVGGRPAEREVEEAARPLDLPVRRGDLGRARQRVDAIGRALASG